MRTSQHVRPIVIAFAAGLAVVACGQIVAPAPPSGAPDTMLEGRVAGIPHVLAPRAARRIQDMGFTTKRFSSDSLWAWRAQEQIAARLRFASGSNDSARVLVELWGPCPNNRHPCLRREANMILGALEGQDAAPQ